MTNKARHNSRLFEAQIQQQDNQTRTLNKVRFEPTTFRLVSSFQSIYLSYRILHLSYQYPFVLIGEWQHNWRSSISALEHTSHKMDESLKVPDTNWKRCWL